MYFTQRLIFNFCGRERIMKGFWCIDQCCYGIFIDHALFNVLFVKGIFRLVSHLNVRGVFFAHEGITQTERVKEVKASWRLILFFEN